eukprot:2951548-Pyramimonas_sp.AAC.1
MFHRPRGPREVLARFRADLEYCQSSGGRCTVPLCTAVRKLAENWAADSQELEGVMSLVKLATQRGSSRISLQLVDARISIVKALGVGSRATKGFKYSQIRPVLNNLVEEAREHVSLVPPLPADTYEPPKAVSCNIPNIQSQPAEVDRKALPWPVLQSLRLARVCQKSFLTKTGGMALIIKLEGAIVEGWVIMNTFKFTSGLGKLHIPEGCTMERGSA